MTIWVMPGTTRKAAMAAIPATGTGPRPSHRGQAGGDFGAAGPGFLSALGRPSPQSRRNINVLCAGAGTEVTIPREDGPGDSPGAPGSGRPSGARWRHRPGRVRVQPPAPSALVEGARGTWLIRCTARRAVVLHLPAGFS